MSTAEARPLTTDLGERKPPRLTRRWTRTALQAHRLAFEEEMERHRRDLDREFERFWRTRHA